MRALVTGATGYVGSAVREHLSATCDVVSFVRKEATSALPGHVRRGDLTEPSTLTSAITDEVDAVVYAAAPIDEATDTDAIHALVTALRGTGKPLLYISGVWVLGFSGPDPVDEAMEPNPIDIVSYRPRIERLVLQAGAEGVRSVVVRPGIVHGRGGGIPSMMIGWAKSAGVGRYLGSVSTTWPMVHVDDLATLCGLALESAPPGTLVHGVTEPAVSTVMLAAAADIVANGNGTAERWAHEDAVGVLGERFTEALSLRQAVSGDRARDLLGWRPQSRSAVQDILDGS